MHTGILPTASKYLADEEMASLRSHSAHGCRLYTPGPSGPLPEIAAQMVTVTASPLTVSQIVEVNGKRHVFVDNFGGIEAKRNARPSVESSVTVSFPAEAGAHVRILPFLGSVSEIQTERMADILIAKIPPFERAIVVWCE